MWIHGGTATITSLHSESVRPLPFIRGSELLKFAFSCADSKAHNLCMCLGHREIESAQNHLGVEHLCLHTSRRFCDHLHAKGCLRRSNSSSNQQSRAWKRLRLVLHPSPAAAASAASRCTSRYAASTARVAVATVAVISRVEAATL